LDFFVNEEDFSLIINCWENVTFEGGFKRDLQSLLRHVWRVRYESDGDGQLFESVEQTLVRVLREFVKLRVSKDPSV
jgi:hypothetical protein